MADTRTTSTSSYDKPSYTTVSTTRESGSGALWFIVGGIVVAIAVIAWLLSGAEVSAPSASAPAGDVSISVEDNAAPAASETEIAPPAEDSAPADAAPAEPAPEETAPAN